MNTTAIGQLRRVVLLTLLGLVLVLAGSVTTAAAGVGKKQEPPELLWKTYPLKERAPARKPAPARRRSPAREPAHARKRAPARDVTTISRGIGILNARSAGRQLTHNPAGPRSLVMIVLLGFAMLLLAIAALPQLVFPNPQVADFVVRRRAVVTATGAALLLGTLIALGLG
jgi:hypothetical protein